MANPKKRFVVLGLGSFGEALARRLCTNGCRVTGVDADAAKVDSLKDDLYESIVADVTDRTALTPLNLGDADTVFISLGERSEMTPSLLATLHAKELGAKRIVVKGLSQDHAKILRSLGVERVVFPETEIAVALADRTTWPNVLDYVALDPEYSLAEVAVPESMVGKSLEETNIRRLYQIWVIAIKDVLTGKLSMFPNSEYVFGSDQLLVVIGKQKDMDRFRGSE